MVSYVTRHRHRQDIDIGGTKSQHRHLLVEPWLDPLQFASLPTCTMLASTCNMRHIPTWSCCSDSILSTTGTVLSHFLHSLYFRVQEQLRVVPLFYTTHNCYCRSTERGGQFCGEVRAKLYTAEYHQD